MPKNLEQRLNDIRSRIDKIDDDILKLIHKRTKAVLEVGSLKEGAKATVYRPEREQTIFERLLKLNKDSDFPDIALREVFGELISACRSLEAPLKISYLGPDGSFSNQAALQQFGSSVILEPAQSIASVFKQVESGAVDFGVVPIENSTEGVVNQTLDRFMDTNLNIYCEFFLTISYYLFSKENDIKKIRTIHSHPQSLAQCRVWLENHMGNIALHEVSSTSEAARIASEKPGSGAISSLIAGEKYQLNRLEGNIQDNPDNMTRFIVLARDTHTKKTRSDKTSLLLAIMDKPGSLNAILNILAKFKINMKKIQSRPSKKKMYEYFFFIDIEGHRSEKKIKDALNAIEKKTTYLKVLGSYPAGRLD